jgi:hypothetical protein
MSGAQCHSCPDTVTMVMSKTSDTFPGVDDPHDAPPGMAGRCEKV